MKKKIVSKRNYKFFLKLGFWSRILTSNFISIFIGFNFATNFYFTTSLCFAVLYLIRIYTYKESGSSEKEENSELSKNNIQDNITSYENPTSSTYVEWISEPEDKNSFYKEKDKFKLIEFYNSKDIFSEIENKRLKLTTFKNDFLSLEEKNILNNRIPKDLQSVFSIVKRTEKFSSNILESMDLIKNELDTIEFNIIERENAHDDIIIKKINVKYTK